MVETNVILCDSCRKMVANRKCNICNKDICVQCENTVEFDKPTNVQDIIGEYSILEFNICKSCQMILKKFPKNEWDDVRDYLLKKLQARVMLKTIEK